MRFVNVATAVAAVSVAGMAMPANAQWQHRDSQGNVIQLRGVSHSVARTWNELLLDSIRNDFARPTVHARNLWHTSGAMWDVWAAYDEQADGYRATEKVTAVDVAAARHEAISYAMYRMLNHRFASSPGFDEMSPRYDQQMADFGYDINNVNQVGDSPAALGNRIAQNYINWGLTDGSNEQGDYANLFYESVNPALIMELPGNPDIVDPNRYQPLALQFFVDQAGIPIPFGFPPFLSPEWGQVDAFALKEQDKTVITRDGFDYVTWHDPGDPPYKNSGEGANGLGHDDYVRGFTMVAVWSGHLDPAIGTMIDASPNGIGQATLVDDADWENFYDFINGGDNGTGYDLNPVTGLPYPVQEVPLGDYGRILAEFWADGPDSETPPGHWFTLLNYVIDHPEFDGRYHGEGDPMDPLELDVKCYFTMGSAMHDAAVAAWGVKGRYDYIRPVCAIRDMAEYGQRTDANQPSFHPEGIELVDDFVEVITLETTAPGGKHEHLAGNEGEIALYAWKGPDFIGDPAVDVAGVGWILAKEWWPYQRPSFVTPPFAGYVSGHSTYSRAAAEVMTLLTGSPYFPAGVGEFVCAENDFLVFEEGPSMNVTLQWPSYVDASDQCSLSRIWGGIHPAADDLPGRKMGLVIGPDAFWLAKKYFEGRISCPGDVDANGLLEPADFNAWLDGFMAGDRDADMDDDGKIMPNDFTLWLIEFNKGCD